jgi:small subunit ribosomal protein S1
MPFSEKELRDGRQYDWDAHYKRILVPTIQKTGMTPSRADDLYGAMPLLDKLWQGIQQAEIIIADLTGRSPNVLYEVGLAHVIGKRILIMTMDKTDVPVDLGEFVQIQYSSDGLSIADLIENLGKHLKAARNDPTAEAMLTPLPGLGGSPEAVQATVIYVTPKFAAVEAKDGRKGFLSAEDYSWTRLPRDLTRERRLRVNEELRGAFVSELNGQQRYSLTALQENPWPRLEKEFPVNSTFRSVVASVLPGTGAFVEMKYGIRGMIPAFQLPQDVHQGSEVKALVEDINFGKRQVRLRFVEIASADRSAHGGFGPFYKGQVFEGSRITRVQQDRGFLLVQVTDSIAGLLPIAKMTPQLRDRFHSGDLRQGDYLNVEICEVDAVGRRLVLRDRAGAPATPDPSAFGDVASEANYEEALPA